MRTETEQAALVLDSWPVLEWIKGHEPAASRFDRVLNEAQAGRVKLHIARMNCGEILYSIQKSRDIPDKATALAVFLALPLQVHSIDDGLVDEAVDLKPQYSFSFADAFAAALAIRLDVQLVTSDKEFKKLEADGLIRLRWVGA